MFLYASDIDAEIIKNLDFFANYESFENISPEEVENLLGDEFEELIEDESDDKDK